MDRNTLITLFILLSVISLCTAGETGSELVVRADEENFRFPVYQYESDARVATEPVLRLYLDNKYRYCRLIASESASASEPVRIKVDGTFVDGIFAIAATSPYSTDYTDESYFTHEYNAGMGFEQITGYNTTFGPLDVVIPPELGTNTVEAIFDSAFQDLPITSVVIGNKIKYIGKYAFYNTDLTAINIPAQVESFSAPGGFIGGYTFYNCTSLASITINRLYMEYPDYFAYDCPLTQINLPAPTSGEVQFGVYAFNKATRVTFEGVRGYYDLDTGAYVAAFQYGASLDSAHASGGAGTYIFDSGTNTWSKE